MSDLSRRQILQLIGTSVVAVHCGSNSEDDDSSSDSTSSEEALSAASTRALKEIDHFVVVMMENRSFDHFLGGLQRDPKYANRKSVNGSALTEFNLSPQKKKVFVHDAGSNLTLKSPPHDFDSCHRQFDGGKNDRFVIEHAGPYQEQAMAFYDRTQIPFYYWLADHFTVCDRWHASVMGPTWPNRLYLHAGTSAGRTVNKPLFGKHAPETIWDQLRKAGVSARNYHAGKSASILHMLPDKANAHEIPTGPIGDFYAHAKKGTLPSVSYIDPHFGFSDDHPSRNIARGQAFTKSIYKALKKGPKWSKTMLVIIYDEHGGFYDHVPPPQAEDALAAFQRFGFRIPAFIAGGMVKRGHLDSTLYDHTSWLATLAKRFNLDSLSKRASNAHLLTGALDPARTGKAEALEAPEDPEPTALASADLTSEGESTQPEIEASEAAGDIPADLIDPRSNSELIAAWLADARDVGAVTVD